MRASLLVSLSVAMFALSMPATAQVGAANIKIDDKATIILPEGWLLRDQERDGLTIYLPLQRPLPKAEEHGDGTDADDGDDKAKNIIDTEVSVRVSIEHRRDHAEATRRLAEMAGAIPDKANTLLIGGWPAIERRRRLGVPQPDEAESGGDIEQTWFAMTAIAVDATLHRLDIALAPEADVKLLDQAQAVGRALRLPPGPSDISRRELRDIERLSVRPRSAAPAGARLATPNPSPEPIPQKGSAVLVQGGIGELEIASTDGQHVVISANSGFSYSDDAGATWTPGGPSPCRLTSQPACDGDPSLAVGKSGAVYYDWIGGTKLKSQVDGVSVSTDNGHTFTLAGYAATCTTSPSGTCKAPDQEKIAADRFWPSFSGQDRVYNAWRDLVNNQVRISCSRDGGATWSAGPSVGAGTTVAAGDYGRVTVGGDAWVYVAYVDTINNNMMLHKLSNCDWGLAPQVGWPITISAFSNINSPEPGLDRCCSPGMSNPKVAVDDLDPLHLYYAFATATDATNEDIMVFDSKDGGATFPRSVRVNAAVPAHRFMPWISTYGGVAVLGWYDRRYAYTKQNDLTRYFVGGAAVRGPHLQSLWETDVSGVDDNQCSLWLAAPRSINDSESCSVQPQLAGRCQLPKGSTGTSTNAQCDFSTNNACATGESCMPGRGSPKYGDYNGNAVAAGLSFSAWTSSTPPASVGGTTKSLRIYASTNRVPSDFYVRDWTATPSFFDNGSQPSTNSVYWTTSDVWNQSTNVASAPGPKGYVRSDPASRTGSNYAFARVSRRAPAAASAPNATVKVNFYLVPSSGPGLMRPNTPLGSETVTFGPSDMMWTTPAHAWSIPAGSPPHLSLAVEIEAPDDDVFSQPSLGDRKKIVVDPFTPDNNKARRALQ
jgi:hypothetical protein